MIRKTVKLGGHQSIASKMEQITDLCVFTQYLSRISVGAPH